MPRQGAVLAQYLCHQPHICGAEVVLQTGNGAGIDPQDCVALGVRVTLAHGPDMMSLELLMESTGQFSCKKCERRKTDYYFFSGQITTSYELQD